MSVGLVRLTLGSAVLVAALSTPARAQGLPGEYAPERGVRLPTPLPDASDDDTSGDRLRDARPYRVGQLVPPGHEVVTTYHGPMLGAGTALFGFHWILSVVLAQTDFRIGPENDVREPSRNNPLMAPVIGPFIALGTEAARPAGETGLLVWDGVAQVGSLALAMAGLIVKKRWLMRVDADVTWSPTNLHLTF